MNRPIVENTGIHIATISMALPGMPNKYASAGGGGAPFLDSEGNIVTNIKRYAVGLGLDRYQNCRTRIYDHMGSKPSYQRLFRVNSLG